MGSLGDRPHGRLAVEARCISLAEIVVAAVAAVAAVANVVAAGSEVERVVEEAERMFDGQRWRTALGAVEVEGRSHG